MSFSKETRNCVGNKMKVTALGVLRELFRRLSDVSGFANFVIKNNKKQKLHVEKDKWGVVVTDRVMQRKKKISMAISIS